jgi:beta-glucanase (GH16 family)
VPGISARLRSACAAVSSGAIAIVCTIVAAPGIATATSAPTSSSFVPSGYGCVWHDEFGGVQGLGQPPTNVDPSAWSFEETDVNGEAQAYTIKQCVDDADWNACVQNGELSIQARNETIVCDTNNDGVSDNPLCAPSYGGGFHQSANYTSARLMSQGKVHFPDGYIEFRVKLPEADRLGPPESGMWPAVWMLGEDINAGPFPGTVSWPACGEVDLMEWSTSGGASQQGWNAIWSGPGGTNACSTWPQGGNAACGPCDPVGGQCVGEVTNGSLYAFTGWASFDHHDWHTYGFKWENTGDDSTDQMTYFIDGVKMGVLHLGAQQSAFKSDMFLIMNFAIGGSLGGPIQITDWTDAHLDIDYVRWYRVGQADACGLGVPAVPAVPVALVGALALGLMAASARRLARRSARSRR